MKKNVKRRAFNVAIALMLVFSIGYFSMLSPTTAWLSEAGQTDENYSMDELEVTFDAAASNQVTLDFDASTKFADDDERANMFEHTVQFYSFTVTNSGDLAGRLYLDVSDYDEATSTALGTQNCFTNGLRWFMYSYDSVTPVESTDAEEIIDGIYQSKTTSERVFYDGTSYYQRSPSLASALEQAMVTANKATESGGVTTVNSAFAADSAQQNDFITAENAKYIPLPAAEGETPTTINVVVGFWVEYNPFVAAPNVSNPSTATEVSYDIQLDVRAVQDAYYDPIA